MKYKYVCEVSFPVYEITVDVNVPVNKSILYVCSMLDNIIKEELDPNYVPDPNSILVNKKDGTVFDKNLLVKDSNIDNGTKMTYL